MLRDMFKKTYTKIDTKYKSQGDSQASIPQGLWRKCNKCGQPIYVEDVKKAGADVITVHAEACKHLDRVISQIKEAGCRAGVALNPATPVSVLEHILDQVDMVLIMTVNPGFGGQKFIPYTIEKVKAVRRLCDERGLTTDIQVDGGISAANVREVLEAGANIFVAGSAVFGTDPAARTREMVEIFKEYEK